jgi:hypothetical protein
MSPENQQTVYTVVDCLALIPVVWITFWAIAGAFTGAVRITAGYGGSILWVAAVVWLALRAFGVVA